ncbi:methyl-accepting chemotaxis protein [Geomesophilobacter sediminis]|uniref:Methyl-accepting chemotaxis protein n=1 Tax=Geomesophilobacter sediminis TaxID=2798584 RepID=A0A8J7LVF9_9BACT|nr:HAMP domain-containing methyl-accepting chemotaxis protein [Geomesophilobacter sediminis]MBJ6724975.1 methyl-accepting chemotaxis protein [Geomesophilobacter sediminis]
MKKHGSIKGKLFLGFGIIAVTGAIVALTAGYAISVLSSNIDSLLDTRLPQVELVRKINEAIYTSAVHIDEAILATTQDNALAELEVTTSNRKATNENMEKLKKSLTSDQEKALYQVILDNRKPYVEARDQVIKLVKDGKRDEAVQAMPSVKQLRAAFLKALSDLQVHVQQQATSSGKSTEHNAQLAKLIIVAVAGVTFVIAVFVMLWIVRSISRPIAAAVETANRIAARDLTVHIDESDCSETGQLMAAMGNMVQNLRQILSETARISTTIATASVQLESASQQIATGTEEVACQTHTVAAASEEMAATSTDIAANCQAAARNSEQATTAATSGTAVVARTIDVMNRIADRVNASAQTVANLGARSVQIGEIVGTIEDIADQTNLLALNAAIEAARAGDQGRGFAVVADEVRALAERTTKATREIADMIKAIQTETRGAVSAMEEGVREVHQGTETTAQSGTALQEILDQVNAVSLQVSQIATAVEEQSATITEITGNTHQISEVVRQTAQGSQESALAAAQLADLSRNLNEVVRGFRLA